CRLAHVRAHPSTRTTSAPTALSPLSLHDALPICPRRLPLCTLAPRSRRPRARDGRTSFMIRFETSHGAFVVELFPKEAPITVERSEEHTSELQSLRHLVCRLLLEKKKNTTLCASI